MSYGEDLRRCDALEMINRSILLCKMIQALEVVLSQFDLEPDIWMIYIYLVQTQKYIDSQDFVQTVSTKTSS